MRFLQVLTVIIVLGFLRSCSWPRLEMRATGNLTVPTSFQIKTFTVLRIDPNGRDVAVDWRGYNLRTGSATSIPFEVVTLSDGPDRYVVSDEKAGNNELMVNGTLYRFDAQKEQLLIRFGSGVSIERGGDYQAANDPYDFTFSP